MMGAQLHLFSLQTCSNCRDQKQCCFYIPTKVSFCPYKPHSFCFNGKHGASLNNLIALFSLLPFRSSTYAGEAGQGLMCSADRLCLFCQAGPCYSTFSHCSLQFLAYSCVTMLCTIQPQPLFVHLEHQSFHSSVPGCLEDETLMIL